MLKILVAIILIVIFILIWINFKLYNYGLNPNASKKGIFNNNSKNKLTKEDLWLKEYPKREDAFIKSFDNLKLHAYIVENKNSDKWAITVHGYTGKAGNMSSIAYKYSTLGYNVLVPDLRGHGESEGSYIGMGWHDRLDIISWINYIIERNKNAEIILHGVSMGASTVMMVSGEKLPPNIKVIIEDCGYTSVKEQFAYKIKTMFKLPSFPILNICNLITKIKANYYIGEASSIKQIKKTNIPILFIHGKEDKFVPFDMVNTLYDACPSDKEKLIVEKAGHAKSNKVNPTLYWNTIINFINKYI